MKRPIRSLSHRSCLSILALACCRIACATTTTSGMPWETPLNSLLSGILLGSVIGAGAQIAVGANSTNPGFTALAVQGAGQNINDAGQQITRRNLNIQPTIEVAPGTRLNIFATKDLVLPPYTE